MILIALCLLLPLTGCPAMLAGIGTAASLASAVHTLAQAGSDLLAATAIACQQLPDAKRASAAKVVQGGRPVPAHLNLMADADAICNWVSPDNRAINVAAPAHVGKIVALMTSGER